MLLKEHLATKIVSVELHDSDEYIANAEDAAVAKFSCGRAKFTFRDFLRANCYELKLRADVFPLKRDEVDNTQNLDLNTTAKKGEKTVEKGSPYLNSATFSVIMANLARPIGEFNEKKELKKLQDQAKELASQADHDAADKLSDKPTSEMNKSHGSEGFHKKEDWNPNEAIFERMILIIPYKAPEMV